MEAEKKNGLKGGGGGHEKNMVCKGVPENNYTFKCCNEGFCNRLKSCQNAQNNIPEHAPGRPTLLCTKRY